MSTGCWVGSRSVTERTGLPRHASGVTLLEVLVAFSILSVSLVLIMSIFSGGLRIAARGHEYSRAVALAESKLAAVTVVEPLTEGTDEGVFDDLYRWRTTVRTPSWWEAPDTQSLLAPREVEIDVVWDEFGQERSVSLTTLRLVPRRL